MNLQASEAKSLRSAQYDAVVSMLNLNETTHEIEERSEADTIWKVLIFDRFGQDIISSIMRVNDLRDNGITVHMLLQHDRSKLPDVPAVYFVEPTSENIDRVCKDMERGMYDSYYVNFCSSIPRSFLEEFVTKTISTKTTDLVKQVYDQYLNFICTNPDVFSLNQNESFITLNSTHSSENAINEAVDKAVDALFSVIVTMGVIPIIRCPAGHAAEMIAQKLDQKLRDHALASRNTPSTDARSDSSSLDRPVLIILDRNIDLTPMLSHSWTYQALIHDALIMKSNRIIVKDESPKSYDIEIKDFFWKKNASSPFPQVAEDIHIELNKYKEDAAEITRISGLSSIDDVRQMEMSSNTKVLKDAINVLPELTARKSTLDMHMNVSTALLNQIKDRQLDSYFQVEESITRQTKASLLEVINDKEKKNAEDKMRFFLIYYLSTTDDISDDDMSLYEQALKEAGCDLAPLKYLKKARAMMRMTSMLTAASSTPGQGSPAQNSLWGGFSSISYRLTDRLKEGGLGGGFENLLSGVKNLLPTRKELVVRRIVSDIMSPLPNEPSKAEDYLYFDPLHSKSRQTRKNKSSFDDAIVFVVGGGNYVEYQNLQELATENNRKRNITYGSTAILSPHQFLDQLGALEKEDE